MPTVKIPAQLRELVIERAKQFCEYCLLHQDDSDFSHQIDHIIPLKYNGATISENLALACLKCNKHKGSEVAALDPIENEVAALFNPRLQDWTEHFELLGAFLLGKTRVGRATVSALKLNDPVRVNQRQELMRDGRYPR